MALPHPPNCLLVQQDVPMPLHINLVTPEPIISRACLVNEFLPSPLTLFKVANSHKWIGINIEGEPIKGEDLYDSPIRIDYFDPSVIESIMLSCEFSNKYNQCTRNWINTETEIFYHGSDKTISGDFKVSLEGSFGAGISFADRQCALNYANGEEGVTPVKLSIKNPYKYAANNDLESPFDFDSYAITLIFELFEYNVALKLIDNAKQHEWGYFGIEIKDRLLELGHDGLIAQYEDDSYEIIAFCPKQILKL